MNSYSQCGYCWLDTAGKHEETCLMKYVWIELGSEINSAIKIYKIEEREPERRASIGKIIREKNTDDDGG